MTVQNRCEFFWGVLFWKATKQQLSNSCAVLEGSAEPLPDATSEPVADSHGTRLPEEAWVPADTDPGSPEARRLDCTVLSGRSENTQVSVF